MVSENTLGVVLAGGRSSRMGQNKALMLFEGKPLIEHMIDILKDIEIKNIKISGEVKGYDCEVDETSFEGPVKAIESIIQKFSDVESFLFVPVDMPFLSADVLQAIMQRETSAYYQDWPLPAFIKPEKCGGSANSVRDYMKQQGAEIIPVPIKYEDNFININTPEEWKEAVK